MSAYVILTRETTFDQGELDIYGKEAKAASAGRDMKVLAFYGAHEDLEGGTTEGTVILEFPDIAAAKAWYESPEYRKARLHRFNGANYRVNLVQGV